MVRHKLDSVNAFARQGYDLRIRCLKCENVVDASPIAIMEKAHGPSSSLAIDDIEHRMRCKRCGHRGAHITPVESEF